MSDRVHFPNLQAEMARKKVRQGDLAQLLGLSEAQVSRKLNGIRDIGLAEMLAIRDAYFHDCEIDHLFKKEPYYG